MTNDFSDLRILLIEDNPVDAKLHQRMLNRVFDAPIEIRRTMAKALDALATDQRPGLIVTDLDLPDSSGMATIEHLAQAAETIPLVVLSGSEPAQADRLRAIDLGAQDVLAKQDLTPASLGAALQYAIKRKRLELEAKRLARTDALTSILNRRAIIEHLKTVITEHVESSVAVLFIDLDKFKLVNDIHGHAAGDRALIEAGHRIRQAAADAGAVAGRLSGDEFCVVATGHSRSRLHALAESLRRAIRRVSVPGSQKLVHLDGSIGIATGRWGTDAYQLLSDADSAMYAAKRNPGEHISEFDLDTSNQLATAQRTRAAIQHELDAGLPGMMLHYQPIIDTTTGTTIAHEALVRWNRGTRVAAAAEFVPILTEQGTIDILDRWVLRHACSVLRHARRQGGTRLHVNLAPSAFNQGPAFWEFIHDTLTGNRIQPGELVLELTEQTIVNDDPTIRASMASLRARGVQFAIDDFGTGFSCLAYLSRLDIDWLKVDRKFVANADTDLIEIIATIAARLGYGVIAEGVETSDHVTMLTELGVAYQQGYHHGRPQAENPTSLTSNPPALPHQRSATTRAFRTHQA